MFNKHPKPHQPLLTAEEFEVRIWGFVVVIVTLVLAGIVGFMLYSLAYVQQPIKSMAPMDQAFAKMLNDIVLLIVGGIGGILTKGITTEASNMITAAKNNTAAYTPPPPPPPAPVVMMAPSWSPPPAPINQPTLEPDHERERMAQARAEAHDV